MFQKDNIKIIMQLQRQQIDKMLDDLYTLS